ncbi:MAG TPA: HIT family protein [Candidatus Paceibacterota bacterium]|nr:HIT family protein [Candidatus Paceibacterota bacterium]
MTNKDDCLFCKIIRKELPANVIYEDPKTMAFLDVMPRAKGHTVIISKTHSETLDGLPEGEVAPLFETLRRVSSHLAEVLRADGLTIGINQGIVSGQTIPHLHIHVMPRFSGDGGGSIHSVVNHPPKESLAEIAERIAIK